MRVTTELFVSALIRRVFASGGFAAIINRGALEAGAVFVISRGRQDDATLFGPASQTDYASGGPDDRRFAELMRGSGEGIDARLVKEGRFDSDIWVVEIEPGSVGVRDLIQVVEA